MVTACEPSVETLDQAGDTTLYIKDIAEHRNVTWQLGESASKVAREAWEHKDVISELGEKLKDAPDWGCKVLDLLDNGAAEEQAVTEAESGGASGAEAEEVIAEIRQLNQDERVQLAQSVCDVAKTAP